MAENKLSGIGSIGGIYPIERRVAQDPKMLNPSDQMMSPQESFKDNVSIGQSIHDTDISEAMKKPKSVERRRVRDRIFDMLDKGEIPTRDMFLSDEEYRYFLKEYNSIKEFISRDPESLKERAFKRLRNFESEVEAAKEGGIRSDRVFDRKAKGYRHPEDSVVDMMLDEGYTADRLQQLKDAAFFSPAAGPEKTD